MAATYDSRELRMNGDTGANYVSEEGYAGGSNSAPSSNALFLGYGPAASAPANVVGALDITIYDYASPTWYKLVSGTAYRGDANYPQFLGGMWKSTAAITDLALFLDGADLVAGSTAALYGID